MVAIELEVFVYVGFAARAAERGSQAYCVDFGVGEWGEPG